ncbi:unnamed protein product [Didymodactylos carnosus]|uniref:Cilia- and flagella-associated protein 126 n=1 Tax=Didymodactylos carnosus TaxID=1234261 RepID=A0A813U3Z0_9BILA|nr:unnamed protein product [Didymodactylos carnosus]CAF1148761.1 unnamed protein product [Didymodactylos carnosus]CAF3604657.1 unnamed protein product [Didymodactylos carnosus]CAF3953049.1 unnamed protein product [Didymodactylos carnosus]
MSRSYSANQYEKAFDPKRLQMYLIPKDQLGQHPKRAAAMNSTNFITDNNGRLLPGIEKTNRNPWGEFIGTWDLPKRIPGPFHIQPMGRTEKNFNSLCNQRDQVLKEMEQARQYTVS